MVQSVMVELHHQTFLYIGLYLEIYILMVSISLAIKYFYLQFW